MPLMPVLHTNEEDVAFYSDVVLPSTNLWLVENENLAIGFIAYRDGWIEQLYIDPSHQRRGLGAKLVALAKVRNTSLNLWTFQCNQPARSFYEKHDFKVCKMTDGSDNEEHQPDILYTWINLQ